MPGQIQDFEKKNSRGGGGVSVQVLIIQRCHSGEMKNTEN